MISRRRMLKEKMLLTRHLAVMLKSGLPLVEDVIAMQQQTKSPLFKKALAQIAQDINNGDSFEDSLKKHPRIFDTFYISMIASGEKSGTLDKNLDFLSTQLSKENRLRSNLQSALIYPAIVALSLFAAIFIINWLVLPRLIDFFNSLEVTLPLSTQIFLGIIQFIESYAVLLIIIIAAVMGLTIFLSKRASTSPWWNGFLLHLPLIGPLLHVTQLERFSRNFGLLLKSGMGAASSLEVTAATLTSQPYKKSAQKVAEALRSGTNIGDAIAKAGHNLFPPLVVRMIVVGEKSGTMDDSLLYLADFYEEESDATFKNLSVVIEPILLIALGLVIGLTAIAVISPIYDLTVGLTAI